MANHVFSRSTITHSEPAEIEKLGKLLESWSDKDDYGLISYLLDQEVSSESVDREVMTDAIGAKWMTVDELEVMDDEIVLMTTTAWGYPSELWENLEVKGFSIDANYEDEMPNFFGTYSTDDGDDLVDTIPLYDAISETAENFESDIKETSDYNNAMYEECVDAAIKAIGDMNEFNKETLEGLVERYLEFNDNYIENE